MSKPLPAPPPAIHTNLSSQSRRSQPSQSFESTSTVPRKIIRFGHGRHSDVELVPQPTNLPNDPLSWPQWRKHMALVSLFMATSLVNASKTALLPTSGRLVDDLGVSHTAVAALTGVPLLLSSFTGTVALALTRIYGRRPLYLASYLLFIFGSVWNASLPSSYGQVLAARVFQGLSWGPFDALIIASIHDMYFEHERRFKILLSDLLIIFTTWGSIILSGISVANAENNFKMPFIFISSFHITAMALLLFGAPETAFERANTGGPTPLPPVSSGTSLIRLREPRSWKHIVHYIPQLAPYRTPGLSKPDWVQPLRAFGAPTTLLSSAVCIFPFCALWNFSWAESLLSGVSEPSTIGAVLGTGPLILAFLLVLALAYDVHRWGTTSGPVCISTLVIGSITLIAAVSYLCASYQEDEFDPLSPFALGVASFFLGCLAGGSYMLISCIHYLVVRSAAFTSPSVYVAQRSVAEMRSSAILPLNLAAGISLIAFAANLTRPTGDVARASALKDTAVSFLVIHLVVAIGAAVAWWTKEQAIWAADGKVLKLVDLDSLDESPRSAFDYE